MRARADARGHIERKGPSWWLRRFVVTIDQENGEIHRQYRREWLGSTKELRTKAAARAVADDWIERTRPETLAPGPRVLAVSYLEHFKRIHLPLMRPTSQAIYRSIIRKHLGPAVAGLRLHQIDTTWLAAFMARRAGTMERKTLANIRTVFLQVLRQAVRDRYGACKIDPREVRLPRTCRPQKPQRFFTAGDLTRILDASEFPNRALWALMGYAGLRAGEALALEWEQIHFGGAGRSEGSFLSVRLNAVRGAIGAPKTKSSAADVPILPALEQLLRDYHAWLATRGGALDGHLFASRTGAPWRTDDVRRYKLQPLLARLGIPKAGLHAFRHSVPRILAAHGISLPTISKVMRHGSVQQTETYLHWLTADVWNSLNKAGLAEPVAA